jgi:hypothetical protein
MLQDADMGIITIHGKSEELDASGVDSEEPTKKIRGEKGVAGTIMSRLDCSHRI